MTRGGGQIVTATGLFRVGEIDVAVELVQARLEKGTASGYEFVFAEQKGEVVGYICFGKNTLTLSSFDVIGSPWNRASRDRALASCCWKRQSNKFAAAGGNRVYIETSHRADYQATRGFYERCGYHLAAGAR